MQERFEFESGGETLVGTLFVPVTSAVGVVVTSGPLTSVKEQPLVRMPRRWRSADVEGAAPGMRARERHVTGRKPILRRDGEVEGKELEQRPYRGEDLVPVRAGRA